jgi:HEAT repeat protein
MTLEKEKKTVRTDATIERETVQTDSPSLNQSAAEAAVRICLDITNRRYVVNQFYPLESLESAFIFEDGGVSKDGRNWGRGWVPLDDCIPQLVSGGKALEWGRVAATKEIWGLRAQFTADEGFGRATSSDRIFFLDDSKQVIGSLPTAVVRLVHGATRAAKAGDSTEVERAIADLQSPEPSQRRDAADRLTFAARQGAFRKTEISETDKRAAVTGLANRLRDVDGNARSAAIKALAAIGPPAKSAVPALIELMHSGGEAPIDPGGWTPVGDLLTLTIDCLGAMVSASPEALAELIGLVKKPLESKDADYRTWDLACAATRALGKAGPDAEQAVPILMDVLRYAVAEPPGGDQAFSKPYSRAGIYGIAAEAIAAIGSGRPMPLLNAHRKGTDVRTETPADRQQIMQDADTAYRKLEWKMASPPKDPPTQKQDPAAQWRATHPSAEKQLDRIVSDLRNDPSANKVLPHPKQPERLRLFSPAGK